MKATLDHFLKILINAKTSFFNKFSAYCLHNNNNNNCLHQISNMSLVALAREVPKIYDFIQTDRSTWLTTVPSREFENLFIVTYGLLTFFA